MQHRWVECVDAGERIWTAGRVAGAGVRGGAIRMAIRQSHRPTAIDSIRSRTRVLSVRTKPAREGWDPGMNV